MPVPSADTGFVVGENAEIRLPTEWEWQWAAQVGIEAREYPWADGWQEGYANTSEAGLNRTTAVGMYPHGAAACGAPDMAGSLWEWCLNDYHSLQVMNGFGNGQAKMLRGGSFDFSRSYATTSYRYSDDPISKSDYYGVRLIVCPV